MAGSDCELTCPPWSPRDAADRPARRRDMKAAELDALYGFWQMESVGSVIQRLK